MSSRVLNLIREVLSEMPIKDEWKNKWGAYMARIEGIDYLVPLVVDYGEQGKLGTGRSEEDASAITKLKEKVDKGSIDKNSGFSYQQVKKAIEGGKLDKDKVEIVDKQIGDTKEEVTEWAKELSSDFIAASGRNVSGEKLATNTKKYQIAKDDIKVVGNSNRFSEKGDENRKGVTSSLPFAGKASIKSLEDAQGKILDIMKKISEKSKETEKLRAEYDSLASEVDSFNKKADVNKLDGEEADEKGAYKTELRKKRAEAKRKEIQDFYKNNITPLTDEIRAIENSVADKIKEDYEKAKEEGKVETMSDKELKEKTMRTLTDMANKAVEALGLKSDRDEENVMTEASLKDLEDAEKEVNQDDLGGFDDDDETGDEEDMDGLTYNDDDDDDADTSSKKSDLNKKLKIARKDGESDEEYNARKEKERRKRANRQDNPESPMDLEMVSWGDNWGPNTVPLVKRPSESETSFRLRKSQLTGKPVELTPPSMRDSGIKSKEDYDRFINNWNEAYENLINTWKDLKKKNKDTENWAVKAPQGFSMKNGGGKASYIMSISQQKKSNQEDSANQGDASDSDSVENPAQLGGYSVAKADPISGKPTDVQNPKKNNKNFRFPLAWDKRYRDALTKDDSMLLSKYVDNRNQDGNFTDRELDIPSIKSQFKKSSDAKGDISDANKDTKQDLRTSTSWISKDAFDYYKRIYPEFANINQNIIKTNNPTKFGDGQNSKVYYPINPEAMKRIQIVDGEYDEKGNLTSSGREKISQVPRKNEPIAQSSNKVTKGSFDVDRKGKESDEDYIERLEANLKMDDYDLNNRQIKRGPKDSNEDYINKLVSFIRKQKGSEIQVAPVTNKDKIKTDKLDKDYKANWKVGSGRRYNDKGEELSPGDPGYKDAKEKEIDWTDRAVRGDSGQMFDPTSKAWKTQNRSSSLPTASDKNAKRAASTERTPDYWSPDAKGTTSKSFDSNEKGETKEKPSRFRDPKDDVPKYKLTTPSLPNKKSNSSELEIPQKLKTEKDPEIKAAGLESLIKNLKRDINYMASEYRKAQQRGDKTVNVNAPQYQSGGGQNYPGDGVASAGRSKETKKSVGLKTLSSKIKNSSELIKKAEEELSVLNESRGSKVINIIKQVIKEELNRR
jgi:hypothetical protein